MQILGTVAMVITALLFSFLFMGCLNQSSEDPESVNEIVFAGEKNVERNNGKDF
jgi:uncharacterized lipoprotein NlpE involved in copper resistance